MNRSNVLLKVICAAIICATYINPTSYSESQQTLNGNQNSLSSTLNQAYT